MSKSQSSVKFAPPSKKLPGIFQAMDLGSGKGKMARWEQGKDIESEKSIENLNPNEIEEVEKLQNQVEKQKLSKEQSQYRQRILQRASQTEARAKVYQEKMIKLARKKATRLAGAVGGLQAFKKATPELSMVQKLRIKKQEGQKLAGW